MRLLRWVILLMVSLLACSGCQADDTVRVRVRSDDDSGRRFFRGPRTARYAPVPLPVYLVPAVPHAAAVPTVTVERSEPQPRAYYLPAVPQPVAEPAKKIKVEVDR